jgi:hypothetical protein
MRVLTRFNWLRTDSHDHNNESSDSIQSGEFPDQANISFPRLTVLHGVSIFMCLVFLQKNDGQFRTVLDKGRQCFVERTPSLPEEVQALRQGPFGNVKGQY